VSHSAENFEHLFRSLTDFTPFPWQSELYRAFRDGGPPPSLDIPTGLGKTSVIPTWLIARATGAPVPRRLVYIVDRRAVVDQATAEADALAERIGGGTAADNDAVTMLRRGLGLAQGVSLAVSTLRGQHVDNRRWTEDPSAPAIIVGTVDMIGSRLLFSGYGLSRGLRPVQAALLARDTLVVLDEAHLCAPFLALLHRLHDLGGRVDGLPAPLQVMALTATGRRPTDSPAPLTLGPDDDVDPVVRARLDAPKPLRIKEIDDGKAGLAGTLASHAWDLHLAPDGSLRRVVVFCHNRDIAQKVRQDIGKRLDKDNRRAVLLTGERRVRERERLKDDPIYRWFLDGTPPEGTPGPAFLVATSAGEVGVDLDADAMVADLVAFERMIQRLGRVNRRGHRTPAPVIVIAAPLGKEKPDEAAHRITLQRRPFDSLPELPDGCRDASVGAFRSLKEQAKEDPRLAEIIEAATTSDPLRPALTLPLVEAWAMTGLEIHPGRPDDIDPWLRGWIEDDEPQVEVAWRRFLPWRCGTDRPVAEEVNGFFDKAPIHPHEILEAPISRVIDVLKKRAKRDGEPPLSTNLRTLAVLLLDRKNEWADGCAWTLDQLDGILSDKGETEGFARKIAGHRLVLQADIGGLDPHGLLDADAAITPATLDGRLDSEHGWTADDMAVVDYRISLREAPFTREPGWKVEEEFVPGSGDEPGETRLVVECRTGRVSSVGDPAIARTPQSLTDHTGWVVEEAERLAKALGLPPPLREVLKVAACLHDLGKARPTWQDAMGAPRDGRPYAKTDGRGGSAALLAGYRHEFGSLVAARAAPEIATLPDDLRDLALHLIVAHHGHARPVIRPILPPSGATAIGGGRDLPPSAAEPVAREAALRFARLQERWGPWGLAWWEAVFRAADWRASARVGNEGPAS